MLRLTAACLALASLSLLLPSEPSYDPWAWLVWGREIAHLELDTSGGPSWKPLPVAPLAVVAPLGDDLSVALWVVLARAGVLLALVLAFRLAGRLAGGSAAQRALAGTVAAVALALTPDWFQFAAHSSEAPLAVALMLWGVERHLEGRRGQALALGALVSLMRPELFPFLALYAVWLWRAEPERRRLVAVLMVVIPLTWLVPEWIGSGDPLNGGSQARSEPHWSLSRADQPWLRALERAHNHSGLAIEVLAAAAIALALARRELAVLALAAATATEGALFVAMTQAGFSGNPRYVLPALAVACVLAGVGAARTAEAGAALGARWPGGVCASRRTEAARAPERAGAPRGSRLAGAPRGSRLAGAPRGSRLAGAPRASRLAGARRGSRLAGARRGSRLAGGPGASRLAGAVLALALVTPLAAPLVATRFERLEREAREVGARMALQRDLARAVDAAGGAQALRALGSATTNRALHSRLAWELGRPIQDIERGYGHRVVFRSSNEPLAGQVLVWGRARRHRPVARVGSVQVYRREGISYRLFTRGLQGFHIPVSSGRNASPRVVTR
jgi:hypothetical protein